MAWSHIATFKKLSPVKTWYISWSTIFWKDLLKYSSFAQPHICILLDFLQTLQPKKILKYIYMCVYIYIRKYIYIHTHTHTHISAYIYISGRCPGGGRGKPLSILAWRVSWTEPGGQQSIWLQSQLSTTHSSGSTVHGDITNSGSATTLT